jgi:hypothetical protein
MGRTAGWAGSKERGGAISLVPFLPFRPILPDIAV